MEEFSIEDTAMTYDEWKQASFYVRKGAKSRFRDPLGVAVFCIDQVIAYDAEKIQFIKDELDRIPQSEYDLYIGKKELVFPTINTATTTRRSNNYLLTNIEHHFVDATNKAFIHTIGDQYEEDYDEREF
jgi:hypothetical protein